MITFFCVVSLIGWTGLAFFRHKFWLPLLDEKSPIPDAWPIVDIIVPARNEAAILPETLPSLLAQDYPGTWRIILIDDHSTDGTGQVAYDLAEKLNKSDRLSIVTPRAKPDGWSGKVAAMQAGMAISASDYVLFTDADIFHPADSLRNLVARADHKHLALTSRMVKLNCTSAAEQLLIPAFVFFFALLYPFRAINNPLSRISGAAGGVILITRKALDNIGGLTRIKNALIDDCALAEAVKSSGGKDGTQANIELTLTDKIHSLRPYPVLHDVWMMVARTAFTQLHYSTALLIGTVFGLAVLFLAPFAAILMGRVEVVVLGLFTWLMMGLIYMPMIRFYNLPILRAFTLPAAAIVYICATIDSARLYWQGKGGQWKGRAQA